MSCPGSVQVCFRLLHGRWKLSMTSPRPACTLDIPLVPHIIPHLFSRSLSLSLALCTSSEKNSKIKFFMLHLRSLRIACNACRLIIEWAQFHFKLFHRYLRCKQRTICQGTAKLVNGVIEESYPHSEYCMPDSKFELIARFKEALSQSLAQHWYRLKDLYDTLAAVWVFFAWFRDFCTAF